MPSLAVDGERVAAVWTATANDVMNVFASVSDDSGKTFSEPRRVNDIDGDVSSNAEQPPRVAIAKSPITQSQSTLVAIWPSRKTGKSVIRMARSTDGGQTFTPASNLHADNLPGARRWEGLTAARLITRRRADFWNRRTRERGPLGDFRLPG